MPRQLFPVNEQHLDWEFPQFHWGLCVNAQEALKELSEPWRRGDRTKAMIGRAAKLAGMTYWRAFDIWYGKARVTVEENNRIQDALIRKRKLVAHNEFAELRTRMARLESLLRQADEDFYSEEIAALKHSSLRAD